MPVYKIRGPDGKIYRYKVNAENPDKEDVLSSFKQQYAIRSALKAFEAPKEEAGFFGSFKEAVTSLGLTDEAAAFAANPTKKTEKNFLKRLSLSTNPLVGLARARTGKPSRNYWVVHLVLWLRRLALPL